METVYTYILKSIFVSGILLGYYWIALRNKRFHYYNRFYLITSVLLSLLLPALDLNWYSIEKPKSISAQQLLMMIDQPGSLIPTPKSLTWEKVLFISIAAISFVLISFFLFGIFKIYKIKSRSRVTPMNKFDFIETSNEDAPFSFFRNLFWRENISLNDETGKQILRHELTHIEQYHSYDKLYISLLTALFWVNPFFWIIKNELDIIHEFIADENSMEDEGASTLAAMLLKTHYQYHFLLSGQ